MRPSSHTIWDKITRIVTRLVGGSNLVAGHPAPFQLGPQFGKPLHKLPLSLRVRLARDQTVLHQERQADPDWVAQTLPIFWTATTLTFEDAGRGAIIVDTTSEPIPAPSACARGHPFVYFLPRISR